MPAPHIWTPPQQRRGGLPENNAGFAGFVAGNFAGYLLWRHGIVNEVPHHFTRPFNFSVRPIYVNNHLLRVGCGAILGTVSWAVVKAIRPSRNHWDAEIEEIDQRLDLEAEEEERAVREEAARKTAASELASLQ